MLRCAMRSAVRRTVLAVSVVAAGKVAYASAPLFTDRGGDVDVRAWSSRSSRIARWSSGVDRCAAVSTVLAVHASPRRYDAAVAPTPLTSGCA